MNSRRNIKTFRKCGTLYNLGDLHFEIPYLSKMPFGQI